MPVARHSASRADLQLKNVPVILGCPQHHSSVADKAEVSTVSIWSSSNRRIN